MSDGPEWFAPKRYGWGATPNTWQGWVLTIGFVAILILLSRRFADRPVLLFAAAAPLVVVFVVICARTTKGGLRWRWGEEE
jgi:hypothetical protein